MPERHGPRRRLITFRGGDGRRGLKWLGFPGATHLRDPLSRERKPIQLSEILLILVVTKLFRMQGVFPPRFAFIYTIGCYFVTKHFQYNIAEITGNMSAAQIF